MVSFVFVKGVGIDDVDMVIRLVASNTDTGQNGTKGAD